MQGVGTAAYSANRDAHPLTRGELGVEHVANDTATEEFQHGDRYRMSFVK